MESSESLRRILSNNLALPIIILSTEKIKKAFAANNLTPAEFFFALSSSCRIKLSPKDTRSESITAPKVKFYDIDQFSELSSQDDFEYKLVQVLKMHTPDISMKRGVNWMDLDNLIAHHQFQRYPNLLRITGEFLESSKKDAHPGFLLGPIVLFLLIDANEDYNDYGVCSENLIIENLSRLKEIFGDRIKDTLDKDIIIACYIIKSEVSYNQNADKTNINCAQIVRTLGKAHASFFTLNQNVENDPMKLSPTNWNKFVFRKEISNPYLVDQNNLTKARGGLISKVDFLSAQSAYIETFSNYLNSALEIKFINTLELVKIRELAEGTGGLFGIFKRKNAPIYKDGVYQLNASEKLHREFADLSLVLGSYKLAIKYYKGLAQTFKVLDC